nr:MAG TPA: hypothetical protein [Caudoviricetes sp.]
MCREFFKLHNSLISVYAYILDPQTSENTKIRFSKKSAKKCNFPIAFFTRV